MKNAVEPSVRLRFPASPEYIQPLRALAERLLSIWIPNSADAPESFEILLALQEAVTNVIRHAYGNRGGEIELGFRFRDNEVEIEICDWGIPFDLGKVPLPNFDNPSPGGYGVYIMKNVTDALEFRREGTTNVARLLKKFPFTPRLEAKAQ